jgi:hypothetical protein
VNGDTNPVTVFNIKHFQHWLGIVQDKWLSGLMVFIFVPFLGLSGAENQVCIMGNQKYVSTLPLHLPNEHKKPSL